MTCREVDPVEPTTYTDAICGETLTEGIDDILVLTVSRRAGAARQEFFVHRDRHVRVLRPEIPLGEVFELE
jgi:hypothetical protein